MCNKSLPTVRCRTIGSCGISVRFQTLSPTQGQVAHALLTRPPLTRPRRASSVRLECVMHAASVNPEPGSNSLKISISHAESPSRIISSFQSYFSLASLLLRVPRVSPLPSRCSFKVFDEISFTLSLFPYRLCSLNLSMLFNFQGAICPP